MGKFKVSTFGSLAEAVEYYLSEVDKSAERARARFSTTEAGQVMAYEAKYQEAVSFLKEGLTAEMVWLPVEAQVLGRSLDSVADAVVNARRQWEQLGAVVEASRLRCKQCIRKAGTTEEMYQLLVEFQSGLENLQFPQ